MIFITLIFFIDILKRDDSFNINSSKINLEKIDENSNFIEINQSKIKENDDISNLENINWYIEIPVINLKAPIKETIKMEVLNNSVGHFEETSKTEGNIGLAGHNRGYEKNYFENLVKLKKGDVIKYKYNNFEKEYVIDKIEIIKNTNWSYLESSKENKITLITCVENKSDYRRCIQAIEKKNN